MKREESLLAEMASIHAMARGTVTTRRQGKSGGEYHVLQCWRGGRNNCRYIAPARLAAYKEAADGYRRFMELAEAYADMVIARTERRIARIAAVDGRSLRRKRPQAE